MPEGGSSITPSQRPSTVLTAYNATRCTSFHASAEYRYSNSNAVLSQPCVALLPGWWPRQRCATQPLSPRALDRLPCVSRLLHTTQMNPQTCPAHARAMD